MIKRYSIESTETRFGATIEIDFNFVTVDRYTTEEIIKEVVEFWSGWKSELACFDGDYTQLFLAKLGRMLTVTDLYYGFNEKGMIEYINNLEGWPSFDGTSGITLVALDNGYIDINDVLIEEI